MRHENMWTHVGSCGHIIYRDTWHIKGADLRCDACHDIIQVSIAPIVAIVHCGTCDKRIYTGGRIAAQGRYVTHHKKYPDHHITLNVNGRLEWQTRDIDQAQLDLGKGLGTF